MPLPVSVFLNLAVACAPQIAPPTLLALSRAESGLDPLAMGVNGRAPRVIHPRSAAAALIIARRLAATRVNFDLGLTQINVRNLARLQLPMAAAFDPCRNLGGGARILAEAYGREAERADRGGDRLKAALSDYNTGDPARGLRNGYVARVYRAAAQVVPPIDPRDDPGSQAATNAAPVRLKRRRGPRPPQSDEPARSATSGLDVFDRTNPQIFVWSTPQRSQPSPSSIPTSDPAPNGAPS